MNAYTLAKYIIGLEYGLVIVFFFLAVCSILLSQIQKIKRKKQRFKIKNYIIQFVFADHRLSAQRFPQKLAKFDLLVPVFLDVDQMHDPKKWQANREVFISQILLPLACKKSQHANWLYRLYTIEVFALLENSVEAALLIQLLYDPIPIVSLQAFNPAMLSNSEEVLESVLNFLAVQDFKLKLTYLRAINKINENNRSFFEKVLKHEKEPSVREAAYYLLLKYQPAPINWDIDADLQASQRGLKMVALKYLHYANPNRAFSILIKAIKDKTWEIRLVAIRLLSHYSLDKHLELIASCLKDENGWIKMLAIEILKKAGNGGEKLLNQYDPSLKALPSPIIYNLDHILWY